MLNKFHLYLFQSLETYIQVNRQDLNTSKNFLKSKEIAKDILNKSGVFAKIKNPKVARVGTLATGMHANFGIKSISSLF